jgi:exopolyphosphatase/guanosine-5'-triphosphate,3'-diphosphate pyrophosphatase
MYELGLDTLQDAADEILPLTVAERMKKYDVRKDRAEVMGIAAIAFIEAMQRAGFGSYVAPDVGVREGVQLELSEQITEERSVPVSVNSALLGSFRVYMRRLGHDPAHGEQVREVAVRLFDELQDIHGLDDSARLILELAALTHDVGEVVNRKKHHKHSEYLLLKGRIPGLESPMREMVAALARAHRKAKPKKKHKAFKKLNSEQREVIRKLMPILRIADALDTDHRHLIRDVEARHRDGGIQLELHMKHNPGLTTATFARRNEVFEKYYDIPLSMEIVE